MAVETFVALGSIAASSVLFSGMAGKFSEPKTLTGASNELKQYSCMRPASAAAKELIAGSSVNTRHNCVF